jgi:phytoene/squalene synthetase
MDSTANLAKSITQRASKQSYLTAIYMVDKPLVNDFLRAYAYFRWVDDMIDETVQFQNERISFIRRQSELIDLFYKRQLVKGLNQYENIMAVLIEHDQKENSKLQSFIRNMFAIVEFDAYRKGELINMEQLNWYSDRLAKSVTDGLQYFIGNEHQYPVAENQYLAAKGAHIVHLLRDTVDDVQNGFINIPKEFLEQHIINPSQFSNSAYTQWVRDRANLARTYFKEGKHYLESLEVLRCKLVGLWYCTRFERILDIIEKEDYFIRETYKEKHNRSTLFRIAWLSLVTPIYHWKNVVMQNKIFK